MVKVMAGKRLEILLNPRVIILGIVTGVILGIYFKSFVFYIEPIGKIYLSLLQMSVIPIMVSAIVVSIGKLMKLKDANVFLKKVCAVLIVFLFSVSIIGIFVGISSKFSVGVNSNVKTTIGKVVIGSKDTAIKEIDSRFNTKIDEKKEGEIVRFIINLVPKNIFTALTQGDNLKIIFFFIILGIMLKYIPENSSNNLILLFEGFFEAFQKVVSILMYLLPFSLCSLIASQVANMGFSALAPFIKLIVLIYMASIAICFISLLIVSRYAGFNYCQVFIGLKDAMIIALGTRNSFAAIPSMLNGLHEQLNLDKDKLNLVVPLGITLCRYGSVLVFSLTAVFAMYLYSHPITIGNIIITFVTSILAAMATVGLPGLLVYSMITIVLTPLGIPAAVIVPVLITLDSIIDPVLTLLNVCLSSAVASIIASGNSMKTRGEKCGA
jgi:proton glutamate symport protein